MEPCVYFLYLSHLLYEICENRHYESVYFKELHNEQIYHGSTIYRAGAAVVSTITSYTCSQGRMIVIVYSSKNKIL